MLTLYLKLANAAPGLILSLWQHSRACTEEVIAAAPAPVHNHCLSPSHSSGRGSGYVSVVGMLLPASAISTVLVQLLDGILHEFAHMHNELLSIGIISLSRLVMLSMPIDHRQPFGNLGIHSCMCQSFHHNDTALLNNRNCLDAARRCWYLLK